MEPIEYELSTIKQFAALTQEQFARMLPDFVVWHAFVNDAKSHGFEVLGFRWVDDAHSGEIHSVDIYDASTGTTQNIFNPAVAPQS